MFEHVTYKSHKVMCSNTTYIKCLSPYTCSQVMRCFSQAVWLLSLLLFSSVFRNIINYILFWFYWNYIFSGSSDKVCWIIEEGRHLPFSEELQRTVGKLRSLVESELGTKYISYLVVQIINQIIQINQSIFEKCKLSRLRNP